MQQASLSAKDRIEEQQESARLEKVAARKAALSNVVPFLGFAAIVLLFSLVTKGKFLSVKNLSNLVNQCFTLAIISVGISFVYAHGSMDLSVGAVIGLSSLAGAMCWITPGVPMLAGFLAAILTGMLCGLLISTAHVYARVPVFVASLCVKYICVGIITTAVSKSDVFINYEKFKFLNSWALKATVLVAVVLAGYYVFEYTRTGKELKAIGGNRIMAYQNGVKTKKSILTAFLIHGALIGLVSMFSLARVGSATASTGAGTEFDVMTAIVLGGFPVQGGSRSKIRSAIVGAFTVASLTNGLTLWGLDPYLIYGIKGLLFLGIVGLSYERSRGEAVA